MIKKLSKELRKEIEAREKLKSENEKLISDNKKIGTNGSTNGNGVNGNGKYENGNGNNEVPSKESLDRLKKVTIFTLKTLLSYIYLNFIYLKTGEFATT
jgi:hypothetical protein